MKKNMLAAFLSLLYISLLGAIAGPMYLRQMGVEAYGLIGFFAVLQSGFNMFDLGFSLIMQRESARYWGGALDAAAWHRTYHALSWVIRGSGLLVVLMIAIFARNISEHWLQNHEIALDEVAQAVRIMAACAGLRLACGFQKSVLAGSQRIVMLAIFRSVFASFSFFGVLAAMDLWGATIQVFVFYQLLLGVLEFGVWIILCKRTMPSNPPTARWQRTKAKHILLRSFSLPFALTSTLSILIAQSQKFLLSGLLDLKAFAYVALAVLVSSGISLTEQCITGVLKPRMALLHAQGNGPQQREVYFQATQWMTAVAFTPSVMMAFLADPLVFTWTGDANMAAQVAPILGLYALGNGFLALARISYALQYAQANVRLHAMGDLLFILLVLSATCFATRAYGGIGAGAVWLAFSVLYLLLWTPWAHHQLMPRQHLRWLWHGIVKLSLLPCLALGGIRLWMEIERQPQSRSAAAILIVLATTLAMGLALLLLNDVQQFGLRLWHRHILVSAK